MKWEVTAGTGEVGKNLALDAGIGAAAGVAGGLAKYGGKALGLTDEAVDAARAGKQMEFGWADDYTKGRVRARRNLGLAGRKHPVTGIPFDKEGYPDFSGVSKKNVKINLTGNRNSDRRAAEAAAGFPTPEGYVWHHHQDGETLQLVPEDIHRATGHDGGFMRKKR